MGRIKVKINKKHNILNYKSNVCALHSYKVANY